MHEPFREQFFPMQVTPEFTAQALPREVAWEYIRVINPRIFPPHFKEALGLYTPPESRREQNELREKAHVQSDAEWIVFFDEPGDPVGWFLGYASYADTFFVDTIGLIPEVRGRGIYSAFLPLLMTYLRTIGYERLTTSHHPNNRAALIADLKLGFNIAGMELDESNGPQVKMVNFLHEDRRRGFESTFRTEADTFAGWDEE